MSIREEIHAASARGRLLSAVANWSGGDYAGLSAAIAELHNLGQIDFFSACDSDALVPLSNPAYYRFQAIFCKTLPQLNCTVREALTACQNLYEKAAGNMGSVVYDALRKWLEQDPHRSEEGLALLGTHDNFTGFTSTVLLGGASHDVRKFAEHALVLSREPKEDVRGGSLRALGSMKFGGATDLLPQVTRRLNEAIDLPEFEGEKAIAMGTALRLHLALGELVEDQVVALLSKACANPDPDTLHEIAYGIFANREGYTPSMLNMSFGALITVDKGDSRTIEVIDTVLHEWDLDSDRERVFELVKGLIGREENALAIEQLENFRHRLKEFSGAVIGWYVISLLLTGNHGLCETASRLVPFEGVPEGFDIDLAAFALDPPWVLFLAKKILGYCQINSACISALLRSCLRYVSQEDRPALEDLIFEYFLVNFPGAVKRLQSNLSQADGARASVIRLARRTKKYLESIEIAGHCEAFRPSERESSLQYQREMDRWEYIQREAHRSSLASQIFPTVQLLDGASAIVYTHPGDGKKPVRQEIPLVAHRVSVERPWLESIDPEGWYSALDRFRSEPPPT